MSGKSSYDVVLNNKDTVCQHCGTELPKGVDVIIDKLKPTEGVFCAETDGIEALCWITYFEVEDEPDPYNEIARENTLAAFNRYRDDDDY